ncbi:MAG TPA: alkaline phosphatase family protein [Chthoniobacterales bacterium]|jgi:predicted AlkP superfamily phosphohydrolase/phosphomutase/Tfp pilus assembly protein PilF
MADASTKRKVLLIGWDAADWEHINPLLEEGLMPTLDALINRGVMGNLATLQPILSPMLWNSVATGKFADKHGIHGFIEPDPVNGGARPYTSTSRKVKAIWNILSQSNLRSNVVGWWASHPAEPIKGTVVTNAFAGVKFDPERGWKIPPGTVHPPEKGPLLARFRFFPTELTEEHILPFIPNAAKIDQRTDRRLESFAKVLSDATTIHAVATALMQTEPWDFMAVYYDAIDHFSHGFMAYHPPRSEWIPEEEFDMYKDVVRGAYRFHDMMLERLLQLAGPDTTVILCSDHGFESGARRMRGIPREPAGPAAWHRQFGILVIAGPGIKRDERIYGASLIDITPTILTLFGLPIGEDMDGRPLMEAFETAPELNRIPSWEAVSGDAGIHPEGQTIDRDQSQELMQQFAALGYIEDPNASKEKQAESADVESKYNLARVFMWKTSPHLALPLLEELLVRRPWEDRFIIHLATAYFQAGHIRLAETLLAKAYDFGNPQNASVMLLWGRVKIALGEIETGLKSFLTAEALNPGLPGIFTQLGDIYLRLNQRKNAEIAYRKAIALDEDNAFALQGLSTVYRRFGDDEKTVDLALRAVSLLHRLPVAHFNIGVAMARTGNADRAKVAFETALRFHPDMLNAHRYLAILHKEAGGDPAQRLFHRGEVARLTRLRRKKEQAVPITRERKFELPAIPSAVERLEIVIRERPDPKPAGEKSGKTFVLVSGLPRSGTSLMMQMLEAGGMSIMTDREREADASNPRGYYEWEEIKKIGTNPELLDDENLTGRAIKCITMLLPKLPLKHDYKVIFMTRPIEEVFASQKEMMTRLGTKGANLDPEQLQRGLRTHTDEASAWLRRVPHIQVLEVDYPTLVRDPVPQIARIVEFLGAERLPRSAAMAAVIDPSLHRKKTASTSVA